MSQDTLMLYHALKDISYEQHKVAFVAPPASRAALASKASSPAVCTSVSRATAPTPQKDGATWSSMKMDGYKLLKKKKIPIRSGFTYHVSHVMYTVALICGNAIVSVLTNTCGSVTNSVYIYTYIYMYIYLVYP